MTGLRQNSSLVWVGAAVALKSPVRCAKNEVDSFARLEDAHAVVRRYKLEHSDWGEFATAEGFPDHLFANGRAHSTLALDTQMQTYIDHCQESATNGQDWDAELRSERNFYESALKARAKKRAALASMIRDVKFGEMDGRIWSTVAELATSTAPQEWFA